MQMIMTPWIGRDDAVWPAWKNDRTGDHRLALTPVVLYEACMLMSANVKTTRPRHSSAEAQ